MPKTQSSILKILKWIKYIPDPAKIYGVNTFLTIDRNVKF